MECGRFFLTTEVGTALGGLDDEVTIHKVGLQFVHVQGTPGREALDEVCSVGVGGIPDDAQRLGAIFDFDFQVLCGQVVWDLDGNLEERGAFVDFVSGCGRGGGRGNRGFTPQ